MPTHTSGKPVRGATFRPAVGREGVVPEGLMGRMGCGRQLAARIGRGLVKAMANVALDAGVQFSCAHMDTLHFSVADFCDKVRFKVRGSTPRHLSYS